MTDAEPVRTAAESSVGDEGAVRSASDTLHRAGHREHLAHARSALGAFVADDHDGLWLDFVGHDGHHRLVLTVKDARGSLKGECVHAGDLGDGALGRQRTGQHRDATLNVDRTAEVVHDFAVGGSGVVVGQTFGHGLAAHRHDVAVEEIVFEQVLEHHRHAADGVEVTHVVLPVRLGVGNVRHALGDLVEVVEFQRDARLVGDREQVQHGVGRSTECHHHRDGVLEGRLGHDGPRRDGPIKQVDHRESRIVGVLITARVNGGHRRAAEQRHAERLANARHRVRGEHARAAPLARAGRTLDGLEFFVAHRAHGVGPDGFEDRRDVEGRAVEVSRQDRAPVEKDARHVNPGRRHQHARE